MKCMATIVNHCFSIVSRSKGEQTAWSSCCGSVVTNLTSTCEDVDSISGLRIKCCREPWNSSQLWLGIRVAMALVWACSYSSDLSRSLGTSTCCGCGPKKARKQARKKEDRKTKNRLHDLQRLLATNYDILLFLTSKLHLEFPGGIEVEDLALSLLWLEFDPCRGISACCQCGHK